MLVGFKIISSRFVLLVLSKSLRKAFLKCSFSLQFKKKWFSSPRVPHLLHVRKCRGIFLYRPVYASRKLKRHVSGPRKVNQIGNPNNLNVFGT